MVKKRTKASKTKYGGSASYARALPFTTTAPNGGNPSQAAMNNMMESNTAQAIMTKAYSGGAQSQFATVPSFGTDNTANGLSVGGNTTYITGATNSIYDRFASLSYVTLYSAIFPVVTFKSAIFAVVTCKSAIFPVVTFKSEILTVVTASSAILSVVTASSAIFPVVTASLLIFSVVTFKLRILSVVIALFDISSFNI